MDKAVFLSYASQDAEAARRIYDTLRGAGLEVWFDQSELRGGDVWGCVDPQADQRLDSMRDTFPAVNVNYEKHFVRDERVFTAAGISAAMACH